MPLPNDANYNFDIKTISLRQSLIEVSCLATKRVQLAVTLPSQRRNAERFKRKTKCGESRAITVMYFIPLTSLVLEVSPTLDGIQRAAFGIFSKTSLQRTGHTQPIIPQEA